MEAPRQATSRRALIAAAAAGTAALVAERLAAADPTRAAAGDALILGADNQTTGFTTLRNTSPGVSAFTVEVLGGGVALRGDSESGEGVFGQSHSTSGVGVAGHNSGGGTAVNGASDGGAGVAGATSSGVGVRAEAGFGGGGTALEVLGPVKFGTSLLAVVPARSRKVTVAPLSGVIDQERLDLTESSKILCTLLSNPGAESIHYLSIDPVADTFTVHMTGAVRSAVTVACFIIS